MNVSHVYRFLLWALFVWIQETPTDGQTIFNENEGFIGCFRDNPSDRVFPVRIIWSIFADFTVEKCIDQCINLSMAYAAVQYQAECYCGDASTEYDRLGELPLDDCRLFRCLGNLDQYCGGDNALLVYNITVMAPNKLQTTTAELSSTTSDTSTLRTFITNSTELFPTTSGSTTMKTPMIPAINSIALYAGLGGGGAIIAILIIGVIAIIYYKKRRVASQTKVVPPEKPYMDLEPTTNSPAPAYESLGTGSVSKVDDSSYENQRVVKQHQIIHQVSINDEYLYEVPVL